MIVLNPKKVSLVIDTRWKQISKYLDLKIKFEDLLEKRKRRTRNYQGFLPVMSKEKWGIISHENIKKGNERISYDVFHFPKSVKNKFLLEFFVGHELVHFYRTALGLSIFSRRNKLLNNFEESFTDIISFKSIKSKGKLPLSGIPEVRTLNKVFLAFGKEELRKYGLKPKNKSRALALQKEISAYVKK